MAWTDPAAGPAVAGAIATATLWNTYVRDNMLMVPPHRLAVKASDTSRASTTTLADDPDLASIPIGTNERWWMWLFLPSHGGSGDFKCAFTFTGTNNIGLSAIWPVSGTGTLTGHAWVSAGSPTPSQSLSITSSTIPHGPMVQGMVENTGTSGVVTLQWAQVSSNATASVLDAGASWWGVKLN